YVRDFLRSQRDAPFSYEEVGASREGAPPDYTVDHNRVKLGSGEETFVRAVEALRHWKMFDLGWVRAVAPGPPEVGRTVGVLARHYGFWSLNACRVVYLIEDEKEGLRRYGFAYGTLPEHGERGEERFTIEWNRNDGSVFYDIYAFSRPKHPLARVGYPASRLLQGRFARDSKRAMVEIVGEPRASATSE
ncbi:MAG: DUF1990 family protein, partial [Rubrobacteraceae bacterium]